jgi:DNA-binding transcriptional regulator YhcF (GntR family)
LQKIQHFDKIELLKSKFRETKGGFQMSPDSNIPVTDVLESTLETSKPIDPNDLSLEALIMLLHTNRIKHLQDTTANKFQELSKKQKEVAELHKILKAANKATQEKGDLDIKGNDELKGLLERAKELGVDVDTSKETYNHLERERLIENIRTTVEDLNVENDMMLQEVTRLNNERYESYQLARTIHKPLHDAKTSHARGARGA